MRDDAVIEGLARIALFLAAVSSYAYLMWGRKLLTSLIAGPHNPPIAAGIQRSTLFSTQKSSSQIDQRGGGIAGKALTKSRFSVAGDWLVPVIVWLLVILMALAIVGFLLGAR
jgi:hypothetical protein